MESIEIFVVESYFKTTKSRGFSYYSLRSSALRRANVLLSLHSDVIVKVYPVHLITE